MSKAPPEDASAAYDCRYFRRGVCLYAERRNPGRDESLHCAVISGLVRDWDAFLDRAEAFRLDEKDASAIWNRLAEKKLSAPALCPKQQDLTRPCDLVGDFVSCSYLEDGLCLLLFPRCAQRCAYYEATRGSAPGTRRGK